MGIAGDELDWSYVFRMSPPFDSGWLPTSAVTPPPRPSVQQKPVLVGDLAQHAGWIYPVADTERRCYVGYLPASVSRLSLTNCAVFMEAINEAMDGYWIAPENQHGIASRMTAWVVQENCHCPYAYGGGVIEPASWPSCINDILAQVMPLCGITDRDAWPNSCNLNRYSGTDSIGWHADDEPLFKGVAQDTRIISLSLGETRSFWLRLAEEDADGPSGPCMQLKLSHGDLCTMEGLTQKYYQHHVPRGGGHLRGRINLTWRWIVEHTKTCKRARAERLGCV